MNTYFPLVEQIHFEGPDNDNQLAYRFYNPQKVISNKTMAKHLRIAVCYWHTFCWQGDDPFGISTRLMPWNQIGTPLEMAEQKLNAAFEFFTKLNVPYFTFHDRDLAPEGKNLAESVSNLKYIVDLVRQKMSETGIKLLWGTANCFSNPRYMAGAATNPNPEIFAYAAAQVKYALEATHNLGGENYVLWGGREGYDTLLNTNLKRELEQLGRFMSMIVEHKNKIGFNGQLLIEPKPCEPTKHQYDFDTATVYAFLQKFGLENEIKVNIEANHATLAGHSFEHEVTYAYANNLFGSIDINRGDPQNGWDTDQFPNNVEEVSRVIYQILKHGGFTSGGFNFDAKVRRQSNDLHDLFYAHIGGIDILAKSLLIAINMLENNALQEIIDSRYRDWHTELGQDILTGKHSMDSLARYTIDKNTEPEMFSGRQELCENIVNRYLWNKNNND
ncbi:MAG: xylose isomerase [Coxiella sp. DG_40]|nr:MAG: xylose isomerase [Coxiella sp. DG_40]